MVPRRHIIMHVQYDRHPGPARSLVWLAPELKGAPMIMTEDHIGDSRLSRTWEGTVDGPTFERFAQAWRLPAPSSVPPSRAADPGRGPASQRFTLDGMNWEYRGEAPIVCVSLEVTPVPASERGS